MVPDPLEEPIDDPGRAPPPPGDGHRRITDDLDPEDPGGPLDDGSQVRLIVEVEPIGGAEAIAQRAADAARAGRGADDGEGLEAETERARRRSLPDHDVEGEVLHGRIEDLLDGPRQPVDLVDEEDVMLLQRGQDGGEIARPFDRRPGREPDVDPELAGDDGSQGRLAEPGRAVEQDVIGGFSPAPGGAQQHGQARLDLSLSDVLVERVRPEGALDAEVGLVEQVRREEPGVVRHGRESSMRPPVSYRCSMPRHGARVAVEDGSTTPQVGVLAECRHEAFAALGVRPSRPDRPRGPCRSRSCPACHPRRPEPPPGQVPRADPRLAQARWDRPYDPWCAWRLCDGRRAGQRVGR